MEAFQKEKMDFESLVRWGKGRVGGRGRELRRSKGGGGSKARQRESKRERVEGKGRE